MAYCFKLIFWILVMIPCVSKADERGLKKKIDDLKIKVDNTQDQDLKSELLFDLAKAYYLDQDLKCAFEYYLAALESYHVMPHPSKESENPTYKEALKIYLTAHGTSIESVSRTLIKNFRPRIDIEIDNTQLRFIIADAYANLGEFYPFFEQFYQAYSENPQHYLAYKTKAILHIKLFERYYPGEVKESHRKAIQENLAKATNIYPKDSSIYRLIMTYCNENEKNEVVRSCLSKILEKDLIVPRSELEFYVQRAIENEDIELTQRFFKRAQEWYQFSRAVSTAQHLLEQKVKSSYQEKSPG